MTRSDETLVRECLEGKLEAYGVLVERYQVRVVNIAFRSLRNRALAEDLAQDVFLRAYRALPRFRQDKKFKPWLMTITANRIRDYFKVMNRRNEIQWDFDITMETDESDALDRAIARQTLDKIQSGISEMPQDIQDVLRLRFILRLDYEEIADALNMPLGTVKSRISRARNNLKELINEALND